MGGGGIAAWFDRLTMSGCVPGDDGGWRISPSPQPSPIKGEGEPNPTWMDRIFGVGGGGIAALPTFLAMTRVWRFDILVVVC